MEQPGFVRFFDRISIGRESASLGEMHSKLAGEGVRVWNGFPVTADAFHFMLEHADALGPLWAALHSLDPRDVGAFARRGKRRREIIYGAGLPVDLATAIITGYRKLQSEYADDVSLAERSSATAEDLPTASLGVPQETSLNIRGDESLGARRPHGGASDVLDRHRVRLPRRHVHHARVRAGGERRPGFPRPRRVLHAQDYLLRLPPRSDAAHLGQHGIEDGLHRGRGWTDNRQHPDAQRPRAVLPRHCRRARTRGCGKLHRTSLRPGDGHQVGQGWQQCHAPHRPSAARDHRSAAPGDDGVKEVVWPACRVAKATALTPGLCGQAPCGYPEVAEFPVEIEVESMSLNADRIIAMTRLVLELEARLGRPPRAAHGMDRPPAAPHKSPLSGASIR